MKRPFRIQWLAAQNPIRWETSGGAFGDLERTIREAKRYKADRVIDLRDKSVVWEKPKP
jgi:hypothetical protein